MDPENLDCDACSLDELVRQAFSIDEPLTEFEDSEEETLPRPIENGTENPSSSTDKYLLRSFLRRDRKFVEMARTNQGL